MKAKYPIIVHRFFKDGEAWAFHPILKDHLKKILDAIGSQLEVQREGRFCIPFKNSVILGEIFIDPDCPNLKAANRRPTVVRAALCADGVLTEEEKELVLAKLVAHPLPKTSGANQNLLLNLSDPKNPTEVVQLAIEQIQCQLAHFNRVAEELNASCEFLADGITQVQSQIKRISEDSERIVERAVGHCRRLTYISFAVFGILTTVLAVIVLLGVR